LTRFSRIQETKGKKTGNEGSGKRDLIKNTGGSHLTPGRVGQIKKILTDLLGGQQGSK